MSGAPDPATLTDSKFVLDSRRVWGGIMLGVPLVLQIMGINLAADQGAQLTVALQHAQDIPLHIMELIGVVQMIYGSWKAQQPLHLLTPYQVDDAGKKVEPVKPLPLTPDVAKIMDAKPLPPEPAQ